jgi:16S rRNA (uracil1498-N3)-methyltransferase
MHRFFIPADQTLGSRLELTGSEAHHAFTVLRLRPGDQATLLDGLGGIFDGRVEDCRRNRLTLEVLETRRVPRPVQTVTLLQAIPKGRIIEDIIEKAVELRVARIVPLLTDRVITRLEAGDPTRKVEKWRQTAIEAIKQCGNPWLPSIETPLTIQTFLSRADRAQLPLVCSLHPGSRHPGLYFQQFHQTHGRQPDSVSVWIGPEGDFTPAEMELLLADGALPISLGPLVLRVETAAICSLAIINYELAAATDESLPTAPLPPLNREP